MVIDHIYLNFFVCLFFSILYVVYNIIVSNVSCCHTTDVGFVFARPGSNQSNYNHRMIGCGVIDHFLTYNMVICSFRNV